VDEQAAALKEVEKLNSELKNLQEVNKNFEKLQKELHAATKTLQGRADKSEATLKTLEASLKAAEVSAASTQKALQAVSWQCTTGSVTHTKIHSVDNSCRYRCRTRSTVLCYCAG
jgi:uncharacterized protein YigA (DUF484 family)